MRTKERNQRKFVYGCGVWARVCVSGAWKYTQQQQHSILFYSIRTHSVSTVRINIYIILTFEYVNEYKSRLSITRNAAVIPRIFSVRSWNGQLRIVIVWNWIFFRCCWCCFGSSKPKREQNEKFYIILCNVYVFLYNQMVVFRYISEEECVYMKY